MLEDTRELLATEAHTTAAIGAWGGSTSCVLILC